MGRKAGSAEVHGRADGMKGPRACPAFGRSLYCWTRTVARRIIGQPRGTVPRILPRRATGPQAGPPVGGALRAGSKPRPGVETGRRLLARRTVGDRLLRRLVDLLRR